MIGDKPLPYAAMVEGDDGLILGHVRAQRPEETGPRVQLVVLLGDASMTVWLSPREAVAFGGHLAAAARAVGGGDG